jgi:hypothetical protein
MGTNPVGIGVGRDASTAPLVTTDLAEKASGVSRRDTASAATPVTHA